jgi:uncharacterized protein YqjF (DUF2071 family)
VELLSEVTEQASSIERTDHRPWPIEDDGWLMGQTWRDLLFAHWRVDHDELRPHVPRTLELETFDGSAWLGITPFALTGLRLRGLPPVPALSTFFELNCRTYVRRGGRPGIWFFSLDASSRFFVETAKRIYRLPYRHVAVDARRGHFRTASFEARYAPDGPVRAAEPGTLDHFLTERYCLYADDGSKRGDIHHRPWPLQDALAEVFVDGLAPVPLRGKPLCHYAARQDVVCWALEPA